MNFLPTLIILLLALTTISTKTLASANSCSDLIQQRRLELPFDVASPSEALPSPQEPSPRKTTFNSIKNALPQEVRLSLTKGMLGALGKTVVNFEDSKVKLRNLSANPLAENYKISFGRRLGLGMQGGVYVLNGISQISRTEIIDTEIHVPSASVIKLPHRIKTQPRAIASAETSMREEGATYKLLLDFETSELASFEADPNYPKQKHWKTGHLPVIPIYGGMTTAEGTALIKPLIRGWELKQIHQKFGPKLPENMQASLRTLYEALRVLDKAWPSLIQKGTRAGILSGQRSTLDINPRNLMWIPQSEVANLQDSGVQIEKEGFFLIEFAFAATSMSQMKSWETFEDEFLKAMVEFK